MSDQLMTQCRVSLTTPENDSSRGDEGPLLPNAIYPLKIHYCGECTMPIEYCEYSGKTEKCRKWLEKNLPELLGEAVGLGRSLPQAAPQGKNVAEGEEEDGDSEEAQEKKGPRKRGGKGQPKAERSGPTSANEGKSKAPRPTPITVQRAPRGKNKSVTVVKGLASNGVDLKVASKFFASKFACGSSATAGGVDEIVIQGDVKDELIELIPQKWKNINGETIEDLGEQKR